MLLLYAGTKHDEAAVLARAPHEVPLVVRRTWPEFEREAPSSAGLVVVADLDPGGLLSERFRKVRADNPGHPLVLVTAPPRNDARALHRVAADAVVWRGVGDNGVTTTSSFDSGYAQDGARVLVRSYGDDYAPDTATVAGNTLTVRAQFFRRPSRERYVLVMEYTR